MNFKITLDVPQIAETEAGADEQSIFGSFPKAKAALLAHFEQKVLDAKKVLADARALRQKDARAGTPEHA